MATLLIVHHTQSGSTRQMADAVIHGATAPEIDGVDVVAREALAATSEDLLRADAVILGTPENFGYMSGGMKCFLDRVYYPCLEKVDGLPYAMFIRAGNDGTGAVTSIRRIVAGLGLREVQEPVMMVGDFDKTSLDACRELGTTMAAGLECGIF